ncbi:hypothetical protein JZO78_15665 [Enterococcus ureilyticus]|uniref:hypothetical protein n=1 Tax=Enterococcus ureilyticus TaxID=1131292 RepID=UPI001A931A9B|nr:hypothetical protein [Enterococcus ureilyticus]MBO0447769.1 hypothetical protein [Enterococcus ureilyticus]
MTLKKILKLCLMISLLIFLSGCVSEKIATDKEHEETGTSESQTISKKHSDIIEHGYNLGDYHFYIMEFQKKNQTASTSLLQNFDTTIINNFNNYKDRISQNKKIEVLPFGIQYNLSEETVTINYFLINNFNKDIHSIHITGTPKFKTIENVLPLDIALSENELGLLPYKGIVAFPMNISAPIEYEPKLRDIKVADLSFDITDLEINGEKVDNNNEN